MMKTNLINNNICIYFIIFNIFFTPFAFGIEHTQKDEVILAQYNVVTLDNSYVGSDYKSTNFNDNVI